MTHSHDKYFKEVFSNKPEAVAFLKGTLSPELIRNIDFNTLKPLNTSYIDENLKQFLPSFNYILNDLSQYTDEEIAKKYHEIKTRTALLLMKNIFDDEVLKKESVIYFLWEPGTCKHGNRRKVFHDIHFLSVRSHGKGI